VELGVVVAMKATRTNTMKAQPIDYPAEITALRNQITPLVDKWKSAQDSGLDMNQRDKRELLALLLKERLLGTMTPGYEVN
jgi:hypothetical protein